METGLVFYFDWPTAIVITGVLFGFLGYMTGATLARNWNSFALLVAYSLLLAVGERFMAHAIVWERFYLFFDIFWTDDGAAFAFDRYYFIAAVVCLASATLAYYSTRAALMVRQYPWLYVRSGPFGWRAKSDH